MKKLISLALIILVIICAAAFADQDVTGTWYLSSYSMGGTAYNPADLGGGMTMELNADGTCTMTPSGGMGDTVTQGTWTYDGFSLTVTTDDSSIVMGVENDSVSAYLPDGSAMFFSREEPRGTFDDTETTAASSVEAFDGRWHITYAEVGDTRMPVTDVSQLETLAGLKSFDCTIENGVMAFDLTEKTTTFEFVDGHLEYTEPLESYMTKYKDEPDEALYLMSDGTLKYDLYFFCFYLTRTDGGAQSSPAPQSIADADAAQIAGIWDLEYLVQGGNTVTPETAGISITMTLNADGTAVLDSSVMAQTGTWYLSDGRCVIDVDGDIAPIEVNGDELRIVQPGAPEFVFSRRGEPENDTGLSAFAGEWLAVTLKSGDETAAVSDIIASWPQLFGSDSISLIIDGVSVSYFGNEAEDYTYTDARLELLSPKVPGLPEGFLDKTVELLPDGTIAFTVMNMTIICEKAPMDVSGYVGVWHGVYIDTPIMKGNPKAMWGLDITLTLNGDMTGVMDYMGPDGGKAWYVEGENVFYGEGAAAMPVALDENGFLHYGTSDSGVIVFSLNPDDTYNPDAQPVQTAVDTPEPTQASAMPEIGTAYRCVSVTTGGVSFTPQAVGGDSSFILRQDGTVSMMIIGRYANGCTWHEEDGLAVITFAGGEETVIEPAEEGGFRFDYMGTMTIYFE